MSVGTGGAPARSLCWNCQSKPGGEYFCDRCIKIQPISSDTDYFQCLGLLRILDIDLKDLERRFHDLSRRFHPDYFQQKSDREKAISLENSATINTAYRTLRDPLQRAEYLIRLEEGAAKPIPTQAPADLFEEILELQESLEEYRTLKKTGRSDSEELRERLSRERRQLEARKKALEEELFGLFKAWDGLGSESQRETRHKMVGRMKEILSHRNYLETVLEDIEETLG